MLTKLEGKSLVEPPPVYVRKYTHGHITWNCFTSPKTDTIHNFIQYTYLINPKWESIVTPALYSSMTFHNLPRPSMTFHGLIIIIFVDIILLVIVVVDIIVDIIIVVIVIVV